MTSRIMMVIEDYNWLSSHLDDPNIIVLDARGNMPYRFAHIENAIPLGLEYLVSIADNGANVVIDANVAEELFSKFGIDRSKAIIVYGENIDPTAARIVWTLMYHGHPNVKLLEIGFSHWAREGLAINKGTQVRTNSDSTHFSPQINSTIRANEPMIREKLRNPRTMTIDARSAQEHLQARIPGSVLHNWEEGVGSNGKMFKDKDELLNAFEQNGITKDKEVICYCHSGTRASHLYLQLKEAGFQNVRLYDGSIIDWAQHRNPLR
ncbi:MAG: rhodanese-like domain-containing protein [Nitrososphaeraceae archaeon]